MKLRPGDRLVVASHNAGKAREIVDLLAPFGVETVAASDLGLPEPDETGDSFRANAELKAVAAAAASGLPALADDSGFCVGALGGEPGIFSARWAGPRKDFGKAMAEVAARAGDNPDRSAWFVCALALARPTGEVRTFVGEVHGEIVWPPRGGRGFGYDPMFRPAGRDLTFGEMEPGAKHAVSHRANAFSQFVRSCLQG